MGVNVKWGLTAAIAVIGALALPGKPAQSTTLADALVQAYQTNPQLAAQQAALRSADEQVIIARAALLPTLGQRWSLSKTKEYGPSSPFNPPTNDWQMFLRTTATLQLYDGGADRLTVESRRMTVLAARQAYKSVEQQVLFNTVEAYMNVRRDQQFVRLAVNNVRVLREQVRAAKDRFEVGEVTRTDVSLAEARLARAQSTLEVNKGALERSRQSYQAVVGTLPRNLRNPPPPPQIPGTAKKAEAVAIKKHPRVMEAQFAAKAAELTAKATSKNRHPTITGQVQHTMQRRAGANTLATNDVELSFNGDWTFYQGGALDARRRSAVADLQQRLALVQQAGYITRQSLNTAYSNLIAAGASITSNRKQVRASQIAFEGVKEEAKLGARTTLDTLDAEQELLTARSNLVTAIRDQYVAVYQVLAEMGLLTAEHLNLGVEIYNPDVYTRAVTREQIRPLDDKRLQIFNKIKRRRGE